MFFVLFCLFVDFLASLFFAFVNLEVFWGGSVVLQKKIREANEVFAVDKNISFLKVDFGQGSALNQETAPVNLVPVLVRLDLRVQHHHSWVWVNWT